MRTSLMSGAGNRFVMVDGFAEGPIADPAALARASCSGGRADGLVLLRPSTGRADLAMEIYNADGSRPEACGNGLRCAAKLAVERGRVGSDRFSIETDSGVRAVRVVREGGRVTAARVQMGRARILSADEPIDLGFGRVVATIVDVGNPHCVLLVDDERSAPVAGWGRALERHARFPWRTNVEFLAHRAGRLRLRVWERGVGETLACGSGACAAAVVAREKGLSEWPVSLELPGGVLAVDADSSGILELSGPVEEIPSVEDASAPARGAR